MRPEGMVRLSQVERGVCASSSRPPLDPVELPADRSGMSLLHLHFGTLFRQRVWIDLVVIAAIILVLVLGGFGVQKAY